MATRNTNNNENPYNKIESIVLERVFSLEHENAQLKSELSYAKAKLEVSERLDTISGHKPQLGFGPPLNQGGE